ncbi:MAG: DinB family protein [Cyclobacteriaceae bacterium]
MAQFDINTSRSILSGTPGLLKAILSSVPEEWAKTNEGEATWSPFDIIGHLIHGEKTDWIPRTKLILSKSTEPFTPFDRFAQFENSRGKSLYDLLTEFTHLRNQNLNELDTLEISEETLQLTGIHPEFGKITLKQLLATWTAHDLGHIYQISRVLAKNYKEETGPWVKYLRVLTD